MPTPSGGAAPKAPAKPRASRAPKRAADRTRITGVSYAWVNCADGLTRQIPEGAEVPEISDEERDRLEALGVFGEHPRVALRRDQEELARRGLLSFGPSAERIEEERATGQADVSDDDKAGGDDTLPPVQLP